MSQKGTWLSASGHLSLPDDEIHIWRATLDLIPAMLERLHQTLAEDERVRAARFIFERDRTYYVAAHGILREVLGGYLHCEPASLRFVQGPQGKPSVVSGNSDHRIRFNLSHSHGLAVLAIARDREVGIDTEFMRADFAGQEIAKRYFSAREVRDLQCLREELRTEGFFLCWTRKEAYVKAKGLGLQIPLASFDVSLIPNAPVTLRSDDQSRWRVLSFVPQPGFVGAVVAEGKDWLARYFQWRAPDGDRSP